MILTKRGKDYEQIYRQMRGSPTLSRKKTLGAERCSKIPKERDY